MAPELAVADGALGFWQAVEKVWPQTRGQRCWVHKTANVLNKLPKSQQSKAKRALQEIWMAETKKDALAAFDVFVETWGVKYEKAVESLVKDRDALLAFYDFPAEHWKHLRTTNVIESSFATVRHRTVRSKGCLSNKTALAMCQSASKFAPRIASPGMLLEKFPSMIGAAPPNRLGGAHGGNYQHWRAARGFVSGGGTLSVGAAVGEGTHSRRAVRHGGLASQACGARAWTTRHGDGGRGRGTALSPAQVRCNDQRRGDGALGGVGSGMR